MSTAAIAPVFIHASVKRRKNTWYSVKDGNWTDPTVWESNASKRWSYPGQNIPSPIFPQVGDDVYINHSITANKIVVVNNLYIAGTLKFATNIQITVNGDLQASGSVDMTGLNSWLTLYGVNNSINNFTPGTSGTVEYRRIGTQPIMPFNYYHLQLQAGGIKYLQRNCTISGNLTMGSQQNALARGIVFDLDAYDLSVLGTSQIGPSNIEQWTNTIKKGSFGNILFVGSVLIGNCGNNAAANCIDFTVGNPLVEFRGGLTWSNGTSNMVKSGTGQWSFTNTQSIGTGSTYMITIDAPCVVVGAANVTIEAGANAAGVVLNNTFDATTPGYGLINKGLVYFNTSTSLSSFAVGQFDRTTYSTNIVGYTGNYTANIPYTSFQGLYIAGTGLKSLSGNTSCGTTFQLASTTTDGFDAGVYNLSVTGASTITSGTFYKTGAGSLLFGGLLTLSNAISNVGFSLSGNPSVEFQGGITFAGTVPAAVTFNMGTTQWKFTTNSQTIRSSANGTLNFNQPLLISGPISLTFENFYVYNILNSVNGDNAASTLIAKGGYIVFQSAAVATAAMSTGVFDRNTTWQTGCIVYNWNGNYTLPYSSYGSVMVCGTGTKSFSGTVGGNLSVGGGQVGLPSASMTLTGATTVIGVLYASALATGGNTIEVRGGIGGYTNINGGGQLLLTTNNQNIGNVGQPCVFGTDMLISGAITITLVTGGSLTTTNAINGNNAASTFSNSGTITYNNAGRPMLTGVLQTNAAANTWIYGLLGNQDILGGPSTGAKQIYRTLTLNGSGVKTLQGYVSVINTYTLTGPATLANNGYTLTNP